MPQGNPGAQIESVAAGRDINIQVDYHLPGNKEKRTRILLFAFLISLITALTALTLTWWSSTMKYNEAKWIFTDKSRFDQISQRLPEGLASRSSRDTERNQVRELFVYYDTTKGSLFHSDVSLVLRLQYDPKIFLRWEIGELLAPGIDPAKSREWSLRVFDSHPVPGELLPDALDKKFVNKVLSRWAQPLFPKKLDEKLMDKYALNSSVVKPVVFLDIHRDIYKYNGLSVAAPKAVWTLELTRISAASLQEEATGDISWYEVEISEDGNRSQHDFASEASAIEAQYGLSSITTTARGFSKYQNAILHLGIDWQEKGLK